MTFNRALPYNDLPLVPPEPTIVETEWETKAVLRKAISANRALALLKSKSAHLPNPAILIDSLTLLEAKASSEIENIFTTHDKLFQADTASEASLDPHTKEVFRYRRALWEGVKDVSERPISTNTFIRIVQTLRANQSGIRETPGTKVGTPDGVVIYTPPQGEQLLRSLLGNLEQFIHKDLALDPLIQMAIMHYQFEAIHPFTDGNGRTGRILNILFLVHSGLLDTPILFLSGYIIETKNEYYRALQEVTENRAWEHWILYMLEAIEQTSIRTLTLVENIHALMAACQQKVREEAPKAYSKDVIELIFRSPFCRINYLVTEGVAATRITAKKRLVELQKLGLLREIKSGNELVYINEPLFNLLSKQ